MQSTLDGFKSYPRTNNWYTTLKDVYKIDLLCLRDYMVQEYTIMFVLFA